MNRIPLPLKQLIEDNMLVVFQFAFSRNTLAEIVANQFNGEWANLSRVALELAEQRALKAFMEFAMYLRALDDEERLSEIFSDAMGINFGRLVEQDQNSRPLTLRELANKIIHGQGFRWDLSKPNAPVFVCDNRDSKRNWLRAEIDIVAVMMLCGMLSM